MCVLVSKNSITGKGENLKMKRLFSSFYVILFVCLGLTVSCTSNQNESQSENSLRQKKSDLLAGEITAVAYSGFRHGQHPDRGDGAINPSESDILEDLQILTRDSNFNLIRLYDSQTNSQD